MVYRQQMKEFFQFVIGQIRLTTKRFFEPVVWLSRQIKRVAYA